MYNIFDIFRFDGTSVVRSKSSIYNHYVTSLGNYQNRAVAIGDNWYGHRKVEMFENDIWSELSDFPFVNEYISGYSVATLNEKLYIFGGYGDNQVIDIAAMFDGGWTQIGHLMFPRAGHRTITMSNNIIHIGGYGEQ